MDIKFWRMGTNHETYVKRIEQNFKKGQIFFSCEIDEDKHQLIDVRDNELIDSFRSKASVRQFLCVGLALGFFIQNAGKYEVITAVFDYSAVTTAIFQKDYDEAVQTYRDSRVVCCLACLGLLNVNDLKNRVKFMRSSKTFRPEDALLEKSLWENQTTSSLTNVANFIQEVINANKY